MTTISRRSFVEMAVALGATATWAQRIGTPSGTSWHERRDIYPEGVASGDPESDSVLLWTRRPPDAGSAVDSLLVEVAEDAAFKRVIAHANAPISADADWTCRVLVGGLKPRRVYWYRFTDPHGYGSRIGRTGTAPTDDDERPVRFVFVSCQNANQGAQNAYRRMIFEDERAAESEQIGFVLHLGDFIYEIVWYPEDRPQGVYGRRLRDIVRYPNGERIDDVHIPTDVDDYRAIYRAYLHDPDIQDARARWPFVAMWDNHEFSWLGWQSFERFGGENRPSQTRKVAANQAFFEYQPARLIKPSGPGLDQFHPPQVENAPITQFDEHGLGQEPNNLTAIHSLRGYRAVRWGRNMELIVTDQRSYRSEEPTDRPESRAFESGAFPGMMPQEVLETLDAGRTANGGNPPATLRYGDTDVPNYRKDSPPTTILGAEQKAWFLDRLQRSTAPWKIWGDTVATLEMRADPQHLPPGITSPWLGAGYAGFDAGTGAGDHSTAFVERGEIYDFVRDHGITGFVTVAGDRHSFWAGLSTKGLPPHPFEPVGAAFVTGSISAPGIIEAFEHALPAGHALRPLFVGPGPGDPRPQPVMNLLLKHGVGSCLEYLKSGDLARARALSDPDLSPHLSFVDMGGHGYAVVTVAPDVLETEFVCIPRPLERSDRADGGPLRYRTRHRVPMWRSGERPQVGCDVVEGDASFSV